MKLYRVLAQSYTNSARITRTLQAYSEKHVLRLVTDELDRAGYYPVSIVAV